MKRKITVKKVAADLTQIIVDGVRGLPKAEQARRVEAFCNNLEKLEHKKPA